MQKKGNTKLYLFVAVLLAALALLMVAELRQPRSTGSNPDAAQGLPEFATNSPDQEAWRARASAQLDYDAVMRDQNGALHQVVCWTGRMQEVVHSHSQEALMVTFQSHSAQSFVALMPDHARYNWQAPAPGVRIEVCGEVVAVDDEKTPTMGLQPSPVIRAGFFEPKLGS